MLETKLQTTLTNVTSNPHNFLQKRIDVYKGTGISKFFQDEKNNILVLMALIHYREILTMYAREGLGGTLSFSE